MRDYEEQLSQGRMIKEMVATEGWQILEKKIRQEIKDENEEIRKFSIEKRMLQEIAAEYLEHRSNLNAYEKVLGFVQEFLTAKTIAEDKLR